jgi:hypothetical protein
VTMDRTVANWSLVVTRVEHGEVKLGSKIELVEGGGPHGCFIYGGETVVRRGDGWLGRSGGK